METNELIKVLAADEVSPKRPRLGVRAMFGTLLVLGVMLAFYGPRADLATAIGDFAPLAKIAIAVVFAVLAGAAIGTDPGDGAPKLGPVAWMAVFCAAMWVGAAASGGDILGDTALACLVSIPLLALPLGAVLFAGLRHKVVPCAGRHGMLVGIFSGSVAAAIYGLHCPEDSPAFFLLWYGAGIVICTLLGRVAGPRLLGV